MPRSRSNGSWINAHPSANGTNYDAAIDMLISNRVANGKYVIRVRPSHIRPQEETGEVEVIDYGGKGGKMRIVHPT